MLKFSSTVLLQVVKSVLKIRTLIFLFLCLSSLFLSACEAGIYHTVKPGQTLYRISRTYEVDAASLARVNASS